MDPITYEIIVNALAAVPNEMATRIVRSGISTIFRETFEFSTAICDDAGRVVAQGLTLPVHVGALPLTIPGVLSSLPKTDPWQSGDVLVFNDPSYGGLHLPDLFMLMPIFFEGELAGFSASTGHHVDVGGRVPGGNAADSRTIYEEGLRIPPVKLLRAGEPNAELESMLRLNVRDPDTFLGDIAAQRAACEAGVSRLTGIMSSFGRPAVAEAMSAYIDHSERLLRERLGVLRPGTYQFADYIEGLHDEEVAISCQVEVTEQRRVSFDFAGTSPAVDYAINCPQTYTAAAAATVLLETLGHDVPLNEGVFRTFDVSCPEDSVVSWRDPHACAARGVTMYRVADAVSGALARALPGMLPAASDGGATVVTIASADGDEPRFNFFDAVAGAWGARQGQDGISGLSHPVTNSRNTSAEAIERDYPIRVQRYEILKGSGGRGRFAGGDAIVRAYELISPSAIVVVRADRQRHRPWGLEGGEPGSLGKTRVRRRDGSVETMPSKFVSTLAAGDALELVTPSGGGFGRTEEGVDEHE